MDMEVGMRSSWLANLKPGDPVIVYSSGGRYVRRVVRFTATQIVVEPYAPSGNPMRFRRSDGYSTVSPGGWSVREHISPATVEAVAAIRESARRVALIRRIRETDWNKQSTAALDAIVAALEADQG